jgi:hypothetical protein
VPFGRSRACLVRFGHAPTADARLARHAGSILRAGDDRVVIECSPEPGHAPLEVRSPDAPTVLVRLGEAFSPSAASFEVVVRGTREWVLAVRTRRRRSRYDTGGRADEPETRRWRLELTDHEREVLAAYVAPLRSGGLEPAGHKEAAAALHYGASKIRKDLYEIWSKMVGEGFAMPAYSDKRVAVATVALAHGLC